MEGKVTAPIAKAMILFKTKAERQHIWDTVKGCGIASNKGDTQAKHQARHHRRAPHAHHLAAPPQCPPPCLSLVPCCRAVRQPCLPISARLAEGPVPRPIHATNGWGLQRMI